MLALRQVTSVLFGPKVWFLCECALRKATVTAISWDKWVKCILRHTKLWIPSKPERGYEDAFGSFCQCAEVAQGETIRIIYTSDVANNLCGGRVEDATSKFALFAY